MVGRTTRINKTNTTCLFLFSGVSRPENHQAKNDRERTTRFQGLLCQQSAAWRRCSTASPPTHRPTDRPTKRLCGTVLLHLFPRPSLLLPDNINPQQQPDTGDERSRQALRTRRSQPPRLSVSLSVCPPRSRSFKTSSKPKRSRPPQGGSTRSHRQITVFPLPAREK